MSEIRIGVMGSVDAGKSTTIGCIKNDMLDDGRGSARSTILYHPHEKATGRTSSITKIYKPCQDNKNYLSFIDLAGHEKYLRTTLHGISGYSADYVIMIVGSNMGVLKMTKEHLSVVTSLRIPVIVVITKIDLAPEHILKNTIDGMKLLLKKTRAYKHTTLIENEDQVNETLECYRKGMFNVAPIFTTSSKTGHNMDLLKKFLHNLPALTPFIEEVTSKKQVFRVHDRFLVKGIGIVVSGQLIEGKISKGDKMYVGPISGQWEEVTIRSIHDNFQKDIGALRQNESGCLALKFKDTKTKMNKHRIKKGAIVADQPYPLAWKFRAKVMITTSHSTTIKPGYQPVINCKTIVQAAKLVSMCETERKKQGAPPLQDPQQSYKIKDKELLRGGEMAEAEFKFVYRAEFVKEGDIFIFREGNLRGLGKILKVIS